MELFHTGLESQLLFVLYVLRFVARVDIQILEELSEEVPGIDVSFVNGCNRAKLMAFDEDWGALLVRKDAIISDIFAGLEECLPW